MDNLYIICILYNSSINEIASLDTFLHFVQKYDFVKLMIMDNSSPEHTEANREIAGSDYKDSIIYVDDGGNIGISKAYNRALDMIKDDVFHVMWSDDDTVFSEEYIENVISAAKAGKTDIISGIIATSQKILSPAKKMTSVQRHYLREPGIYRNIYCINTGLTIKSTVFEKAGRYDERLFLDAIDYLFSDKLIDHGINLTEIVPGKITQDFSLESDNLAARKRRARIFTRDWFSWWKIEHRHGAFIFKEIISVNVRVTLKAISKIFGK